MAGLVGSTVIAGILAGVSVALIGLAIVGHIVQRSRQRAEARLDAMQSRVLQLAVTLSDQTRAEGHEARLRLIRAAHAAMQDAPRPGAQQ
jgi:hypothetical protein